MEHNTKYYDIIIIGAGVAGCCLARELSRFEASFAVLEAGNDLAFATSRANSGIVHAGYDPHPGSLKAEYCVKGNRLFAEWAADLEFAYIPTGSLVVAFSEADLEALRLLQEQAQVNGVTVELLDAAEARRREPALSDEVTGALFAPSAGICDPYGLTFGAAENAAENGVQFFFEQRVMRLERTDVGFAVTTASGETLQAAAVVNAAGVHADEVNNMLSAHKLSITPVRGEYLLYDTCWGSTFSHVVFQAPGALSKGPLITPTVHGNLIVGPNAVPQTDKSDVSTTEEGLDYVLSRAQKTWPQASKAGVIANFAGLRAKGSGGDFVLGEAPDVPGFYNIACFESPGLTAAPAVAVDLAGQIASALSLEPQGDFNPRRRRIGHKLFVLMSEEERKRAIDEDPDQGQIVCRCCNVSRADLVFELKGILPVLSMDALKWRTGITMGRCHGGFCSPELSSIVFEYTGQEPHALDKRQAGSPFVLENSTSYKSLDSSAHGTPHSDLDTPNSRPTPSSSPSSEPGASCTYDLVIVGAGAAGMAAATAAQQEGVGRIALLDREDFSGGILRQCIHNGFGLTRFKKELTGPEYASREAAALASGSIDTLLNTTALTLEPPQGPEAMHRLTAVNAEGMLEIHTKALVLATGSRERGQGSLALAGSRPAGVYSAGSAQNLINLKGCLPGRKVIIQGSGDIGLIMARRCLFSGADVLGVFARSSKPSGLRRNVRQCLDDFGIPFYGNRLVTRLEGEGRLEAVWISRVEPATKQVIPGSEERWACDTLLLSIGLLPENELAMTAGVDIDTTSGGPNVDIHYQTNVPGIFACGNSLHIHDLADSASAEGERAGRAAARFALGRPLDASQTSRTPRALSDAQASDGEALSSQTNEPAEADGSSPKSTDVFLAAEPDLILTCVRCPKGCELSLLLAPDGSIKQVAGEGCKLGLDYAAEEITAPQRIVTASLSVEGTLEPVSVRTRTPVNRELVFAVLEEARALELHTPIEEGAVLKEDIAHTGVALVATKSV